MVFADVPVDGAALRDALVRFPRNMCWQVIRTWSFAWMTTERTQAFPILTCRLGCVDFIDSLSHYISCPHIWSNISRITSHAPGVAVKQRLALTLRVDDVINLSGWATMKN